MAGTRVPKLGFWVRAQTSRSPREALELLRAMPGPENVACPFRYQPREAYEHGLTNERINAAIDAASLVEIPLRGLVCGQHTVSREIVEQYLLAPGSMRRRGQLSRPISQGGWPIDYPIVCERGGIRYIHDGTHRCTATLLLGARSVEARLAILPG